MARDGERDGEREKEDDEKRRRRRRREGGRERKKRGKRKKKEKKPEREEKIGNCSRLDDLSKSRQRLLISYHRLSHSYRRLLKTGCSPISIVGRALFSRVRERAARAFSRHCICAYDNGTGVLRTRRTGEGRGRGRMPRRDSYATSSPNGDSPRWRLEKFNLPRELARRVTKSVEPDKLVIERRYFLII